MDKDEVVVGEFIPKEDNVKQVFKKTKLNNTITGMFKNANIPVHEEKFDWSDVTNIYTEIATGIVNISLEFNNAIATLVASNKFEKDVELIAVVNTFKNDLLEFANVLEVIKDKIGDYSGEINNEDELALNIEIFNDLAALYDKFRSVIQPHMLEVTERIIMLNSQPKEEVNVH